MKTFLNKIKLYVLTHKIFVAIIIVSLVTIIIFEPELLLVFFVAPFLSFKGEFTNSGNFSYHVGQLIYIVLVVWAAVHVHKINSEPKVESVNKYPITQRVWFWCIIITFLYPILIFSYNSQSNFNFMSRLGGVLGLFAPIGPSNIELFSAFLLVAVLIVVFKMEKKSRQVERMSTRKRIVYILCVFFVLTFFVDFFGFFTASGSYNYFVQYSILNQNAYMDLKNIQ